MNKIKKFLKEKDVKGKIKKYAIATLSVGGVLCLIGLGVKAAHKDKPDDGQDIVDAFTEPIDFGKDLEMQFVDPETKEILCTIPCTESFMEDMKDVVED